MRETSRQNYWKVTNHADFARNSFLQNNRIHIFSNFFIYVSQHIFETHSNFIYLEVSKVFKVLDDFYKLRSHRKFRKRPHIFKNWHLKWLENFVNNAIHFDLFRKVIPTAFFKRLKNKNTQEIKLFSCSLCYSRVSLENLSIFWVTKFFKWHTKLFRDFSKVLILFIVFLVFPTNTTLYSFSKFLIFLKNVVGFKLLKLTLKLHRYLSENFTNVSPTSWVEFCNNTYVIHQNVVECDISNFAQHFSCIFKS